MALVELRDYRYRYPGTDALALDEITVSLDAGEVLGVIGATGAGKTTLCQALCAIVPQFYKGAVGGEISVCGHDPTRESIGEVCRDVGLVFQEPRTQLSGAKFSVFDEVAFGPEQRGVAREEIRARVEEALRTVGLSDFASHDPFSLSGGQTQRLAIASILAMRPSLLVLDEPTSQLDPKGTAEVVEALRSAAASGLCIVIAEQKLELLGELAGRLLLLDNGKQAALDSPARLFAGSALPAAGLEVPPASELGRRLEPGAAEVPTTVGEAVALLRRHWNPAAAADAGSTADAAAVTGSSAGAGDGAGDGATAEDDGAAQAGRPAHAVQQAPARSSATDAAPHAATVEFEEVSFAYEEGKPVVSELSLRIFPGSTALVGENGAGKSTLMRLLNGLLRPARGAVHLNGEACAGRTVAQLSRTVGLVFQDPRDQLFKSTVLSEVSFGPRNIGQGAEEAERSARAALDRVGLAEHAAKHPYDLPFAERKLVCIAAALAMDQPIIVLDEPTVSQDAAGRATVGRIIRELAEHGKTVITVSHDMEFVARYCPRVVVMSRGSLLAHGAPASLFSQPELLHRAGLQAPQCLRISAALGISPPALTAEELLRHL